MDSVARLAAGPSGDAERRYAEVVADGPVGTALVVELVDVLEPCDRVPTHATTLDIVSPSGVGRTAAHNETDLEPSIRV